MSYRRAQNVIAGSKLLLPICVLWVGYAWVTAGYAVKGMWIQAACLLLTVYMMEMLNYSHTLLREDSRMTGSLVLLLNAAALFMQSDIRVGIMQLCMAGMFFTMFYSYEQRQATGWIYYAFLCVGLASMVFIKILFFVPLLWIILLLNLRSLNIKTFIASLLGLITPYWFTTGWYAYQGEMDILTEHFRSIGYWQIIPNYMTLGEHALLTIAWGYLLALVSIIHYIRQGYHDNIRSRMFYNAFMTIDLGILLFMGLQPQYYLELFSMHIVCVSPLLAHYLTLTRTWLTNISFFFIIIITLAIGAYHLWMPSSNFLSAMVTGAC